MDPSTALPPCQLQVLRWATRCLSGAQGSNQHMCTEPAHPARDSVRCRGRAAAGDGRGPCRGAAFGEDFHDRLPDMALSVASVKRPCGSEQRSFLAKVRAPGMTAPASDPWQRAATQLSMPRCPGQASAHVQPPASRALGSRHSITSLRSWALHPHPPPPVLPRSQGIDTGHQHFLSAPSESRPTNHSHA